MHGNVVYMVSLFYGKMLAEMQKKWLTYQCKQYIILTFVVNMRKWRNWQTRRLQMPVVAIPCGFKSRLPHSSFCKVRVTYNFIFFLNAEVAELADAQASGACGSNTVWVQVPSSAFFYTIVCGNAELWSQ